MAAVCAVSGAALLPAAVLEQRAWQEADLFKACGRLNPALGLPLGHSTTMVVDGKLILTAAKDGGSGTGYWAVLDLADPTQPTLLARMPEALQAGSPQAGSLVEAHGWGIACWQDRRLAVLPAVRGIQIWDLTEPAQARMTADLRLPGLSGGGYGAVSFSVAVQAPWAYIAGLGSGLHVVDLRDPAQPKAVAHLKPGTTGGFKIGAVHAVGDLLAISATDGSGIALLDIGDPRAPRLIASRNQAEGGPPVYFSVVNGERLIVTIKAHKTMGKAPNPAMDELLAAQASALALPESTGRHPAKPMGPTIALYGLDGERPLQLLAVGYAGMSGGYAVRQDNIIHVGASTEYRCFSWPQTDGAGPVTALQTGRRFGGVGGKADLDFISLAGNLAVVGDDHGSGSYLVPFQTAPDRTPPEVTMMRPRPGSTAVATTACIGLTFSDMIDPATLHAKTAVLRRADGTAIPVAFSHQSGIVNIAPMQELAAGTAYELTVTGLADAAGNRLAVPYIAGFRTR